MQADAILTEVVARSLTLAAEEMGATLISLAFSPNIKERWDCSSAIFDAEGNVIAQANRVPLHLGSMIGAVEALRAKYPVERIAPGDMFLANDPYSGGGTHLPDINIIAPVFADGAIVAYVANIAHHADVGGMVSGSESTLCTSIFQEGIRLPMVRICRTGVIEDDIFDIIRLNSRTPDERVGDLQAQIAACRVGAERVGGLFDRHGRTTVAACIAHFLEATGRRFTAAVLALPDGVFDSEEFLDPTGADAEARLHVRLKVAGGRLHFDFSDTAPQLTGSSRNVPRKAVLATVYAIAKSMLDADVPPNSGYFDRISVITRPGTVTDPTPPAAVGTRSITCGVLGDLIVAVLSQAVAVGAMADSGPHHLVVFAGPDPRHNGYFVDYETIAGGAGARVRQPGLDGVRVHASGAANLPIEALENAFPMRVERYEMRKDSGGSGRMRGGAGVVRDYRVLADNILVSLSSARQTRAAQGRNGGGEGLCGRFMLNPDTGRERILPAAAVDLALERGDLLRVLTPGGGGMG
ncbi:MAG TPA: hydantoinase B/oxoprolinase family protein [Rhodopila sp.]|nr:hydantoinase B/oxoprolinase family protein [Rhodopila sp.]